MHNTKSNVFEQQIEDKEATTEIMLIWNNVIASVTDKAEQFQNIENNIDGYDIKQLKVYGNTTLDLFDNIFNIIKRHNSFRRMFAYCEYMESDKVSLADIAPKYRVSRERIRQFVRYINQRIFGFFKKQMLLDDDEFNRYVKQLADVFEELDYDIIPLIAYGFDKIEKRKQQTVLNTLFGLEIGEKLLERSRIMTAIIEEVPDISKKNLKKWDQYRSKICYPSEYVADNSIQVVTCEREVEYEFEKRFYKKIQNFEGIKEIIKYPDIVYYSTPKNDFRPNFLLRLDNGTSVLILVLPTANMAYIYNIQRFNELHTFCKKNGYGYLITDNRENSIYDIKNRSVDPELVEYLNTVLNKQTMIVWKNIKEIKQTRAVSNVDIAAYVLQNKLHFTMKPFCIKKRENF